MPIIFLKYCPQVVWTYHSHYFQKIFPSFVHQTWSDTNALRANLICFVSKAAHMQVSYSFFLAVTFVKASSSVQNISKAKYDVFTQTNSIVVMVILSEMRSPCLSAIKCYFCKWLTTCIWYQFAAFLDSKYFIMKELLSFAITYYILGGKYYLFSLFFMLLLQLY